MKRYNILAVFWVVVLGLGLLAAAMIPRIVHDSSVQRSAATYYCPMHPTYTSDKPGDCPICNMKLVKRETAASATQPKAAKDICYLHNCPKAHEGKPCPMLVVAKKGEAVTCPICGMHVAEAATQGSSRTILYWTDPMIPGYRAQTPGKSPMGMDLVPVYEDDAAGVAAGANTPEGYAPVLVTPQKLQLIGIKTAPSTRQHLTKTIRAAGTIAHDPELYQAQAEFIEARRALMGAHTSGLPEVIEQSQRLLESTVIRLKHLGLSDEVIAQLGTQGQPDASLLYTSAGAAVWMYAKIYEADLPDVRAGQTVRVEAQGLPGQVFAGVIRAVDPLVDPMTRTTRARAQLDNPQGELKPDMFVNATIDVDRGEVLTIPAEAVFDTGTKQIVFVNTGEGLFEPRDVVLGSKAQSAVEVKAGVAEGELVVTSGNFLIDSESRLKAALEGLGSGAPEHEH